jgi:hypothetical protein
MCTVDAMLSDVASLISLIPGGSLAHSADFNGSAAAGVETLLGKRLAEDPVRTFIIAPVYYIWIVRIGRAVILPHPDLVARRF